MSETDEQSMAAAGGGADGPNTAFHLLLDPEEVPVTRTALKILIDDAAHEGTIRALARSAQAKLPGPEEQQWPFTMPLEPGEMKILHTSLHLLLDDLQQEQHDEMQVLHGILGKLPDEHAIRAIQLD